MTGRKFLGNTKNFVEIYIEYIERRPKTVLITIRSIHSVLQFVLCHGTKYYIY